jgi:hypothetical protein
MQQFQENGPDLAIKLIEWNAEKVKSLFLALLPTGPLFEGYNKDDTIKGCLTVAIVEMILLFLNEHNNKMKQLNWLQADELLPSWEKLCSLNAKNLTIEERRINVAIRMGLTRTIVSLEDLSAFIRYLGLDFISVKHFADYYTETQLYYDYEYDSVYYGQPSFDYGLVWELYAEKAENNERLKKVLQILSIQTARHIFVEVGEILPNIALSSNEILMWNNEILTF